MARPRDEFSDRQKAAIFVRDRALCCFSGKSLWVLDYGAGPASADEVDHIEAAARGGAADLENGQLSAWIYNQLKGVSGGMPLFRAGRPTVDFFTFHERVPEYIVAHLQRFRTLHPSDWYFNQALHCFMAAANPADDTRVDGRRFARGREYYCRRTLKRLTQWHRELEAERPLDFGARGLLPADPTADHKLLMRLFSASNLDEIMRMAGQFEPYRTASWQAYVDLAGVVGVEQAQALLARIDADVYVVPRVRAAVRHNVAALFGIDACGTHGTPAVVTTIEVLGDDQERNKLRGQPDASAPVERAALAPQDADGHEPHREVFTIGQEGLASPARFAELVARLGAAHVVDTRAPAPSHGPWSPAQLAPLLGDRLVTSGAGIDAGEIISALPAGRVVVLGSAKDPGEAPGRLALGEEHPEWDIFHIYHYRPTKPFADAQCIAHAVLAPHIAQNSGYEYTRLDAMFVDADAEFDYSYTALTFPNSRDRAAAADLFAWDQSPWQDGTAFMASFQEFLAYRAVHPARSREDLAIGAARLMVELIDPVRAKDPRITNRDALVCIGEYLRQALDRIGTISDEGPE